ncbi:MAG: hypothetical protein SCK70_12545, partial [bacterium]|nr:hypothetical protein [bacterium]
SQRYDGGWSCERLRQRGEKAETETSCPAATIFAIRLLGRFACQFCSVAEPAIDLFRKKFSSRSDFNCRYCAPNNFNPNKLRYPPHYSGLDVLNIVDTLSMYPELSRGQMFDQLVLPVLQRWNGDNLLTSQKRIAGWGDFDFAHNQRQSSWISALFVRALSRVYLSDNN